MKRIEFIAPVEAMRGNLSGKQELEYPLNQNPAFYAPTGKHYATNYQPRFIGAKRASDNLKYFAVRTKSAINMTTKSILAMAALGAAGAIVGAILADKSSALYIALQDAYASTKPMQDGKAISFRKWLTSAYVGQLKAKAPMLFRTYNNNGTPGFIFINNPFVSGGTATYDVTISNDVLVKFWSILANNPVVVDVEGAGMCIGHDGDTFGQIISSNYNVLDLTSETIEGSSYVKVGGSYLKRKDSADPEDDWGSVVTSEEILEEPTFVYGLGSEV